MKKVLTGIFVLSLLFALTFTALPQRDENTGKIKIGTPDDTGGMIIHYLVNEKGFQDAAIKNDFETYPLKDCCVSASQWALSTDLIDLAVMCPDAAENLLGKDNRFEVFSPVLLNSDVVVVKPGISPQKIGVVQNRGYQLKIVNDKFGPDSVAVPMLQSAIPYAFEKNAVDGVVVDLLKSYSLEGDKLASATKGGDNVTYVLVVRKSFKEDPRFREFITLLQQSANELNQPDILQAEIYKYQQITITKEEVEKWSRFRIRFLFTIPETAG